MTSDGFFDVTSVVLAVKDILFTIVGNKAVVLAEVERRVLRRNTLYSMKGTEVYMFVFATRLVVT